MYPHIVVLGENNMENTKNITARVIVLIMAILFGGLLAMVINPTISVVEIEKQVPVFINNTETLVEVITIETEVEVIKEVEVITEVEILKEVEVIKNVNTIFDKAVDLFVSNYTIEEFGLNDKLLDFVVGEEYVIEFYDKKTSTLFDIELKTYNTFYESTSFIDLDVEVTQFHNGTIEVSFI